MGHKLTDKSTEPDPPKVEAIKEMPRPRDEAKKRKKDPVFVWSNMHENAFNSAKQVTASATVLRYYDPSSPVTLRVVASENAIGRGRGGVILSGKPTSMFYFAYP